MIYFDYIDPANAKPGDYTFGKRTDGIELLICVRSKDDEGNHWNFVKTFHFEKYQTEIIDGKPTPALIARFTGNNGKRFEINGKTLVKTVGGITLVGSIQPLTNQTGYYFEVESNGRESAYRFNDTSFSGTNLKKAETERARLIEWLEGA